MTTSQPSLRERHRARTLAEIHQAALDLAGEGSYSDTTVDAVAERAGVSRRTFFNYYASKEDAVLGLTPPHITEAAHARYMDRSTGDEFARTVRLFMDVLRDATGAPELTPQRRQLVETHPELKRRRSVGQRHAEQVGHGGHCAARPAAPHGCGGRGPRGRGVTERRPAD